MKYSISKQWIFTLIAGASITLSLVGLTQALPQRDLAQNRSTPLSPNDPGAKLDPNLVNVPAMPEQNTENSPNYPLSPNDPDAQLDPNLVNATPMPEQREDSTGRVRPTQSPDQEVNYDPSTGATGVGEIKSVTPSRTSKAISEPNRGANSK